jgi:hypothetical protein
MILASTHAGFYEVASTLAAAKCQIEVHPVL